MFRTITFVLLVGTQSAAGATILADDDFTDFRASGLSPGGGGGTLDSDLWSIAGASDGDTDFGDTRSGGDFARGPSAGGVSTGGVYAFLLPGDEPGVGVQATGGDFSPGRLTRRVVNTTHDTLGDLTLALDLWFLNNGRRSTRMGVAVATPEAPGWTPLTAFQLDTPTTVDTLGWQALSLLAPLPLVTLDPGASLLIGWHFDDHAGSGSRDEIALSALRLSGHPLAPASPQPLGGPAVLPLCLAGLGLAAARRRRLTSRPAPASTC